MSKHEDEELVPHPHALIESLRSFGYTPETSVADLVDNSISAGATIVSVNFNWEGPESWVSIADNGEGMSEDTLREAMRAGSADPLEARSENDLGRFGLGLKTASFSQGRSLTVLTKKDRAVAVRRWDLNHVRKKNRWALQTTEPAGVDLSKEALGASGTVVAWHDLDRVVDDRPMSDPVARTQFFKTVDAVYDHLEVVFHRFISDGLSLIVNGRECRAWDPFLTDYGSDKEPEEKLNIRLENGAQQTLSIQPFVLPHKSKLPLEVHRRAAGVRGWNLQQGFYLYRANRLIIAGDWFNAGAKPEEHHKLARIQVEITQEMDEQWALDVRKAKARPPAELRSDFDRIGKATRSKAEEVYRSRGKREVGQGKKSRRTEPVWRVLSDEKSLDFEVNQDHIAVRSVLDSLSRDNRRQVITLLALLQKTIPVNLILSQGFRDESKLGSSEKNEPSALRELAVGLFKDMVADGAEPSEARAVISRTQPFCDDPVLLALLEESE